MADVSKESPERAPGSREGYFPRVKQLTRHWESWQGLVTQSECVDVTAVLGTQKIFLDMGLGEDHWDL